MSPLNNSKCSKCSENRFLHYTPSSAILLAADALLYFYESDVDLHQLPQPRGLLSGKFARWWHHCQQKLLLSIKHTTLIFLLPALPTKLTKATISACTSDMAQNLGLSWQSGNFTETMAGPPAEKLDQWSELSKSRRVLYANDITPTMRFIA